MVTLVIKKREQKLKQQYDVWDYIIIMSIETNFCILETHSHSTSPIPDLRSYIYYVGAIISLKINMNKMSGLLH